MRGVHLVACNGELLLVVLRFGSHPSPAEVYKPEWMPDLQVELHQRVMDLGDYSLFVGRGDTFSLSAKEFPSIKRYCVYYADNLITKSIGYLCSIWDLMLWKKSLTQRSSSKTQPTGHRMPGFVPENP